MSTTFARSMQMLHGNTISYPIYSAHASPSMKYTI